MNDLARASYQRLGVFMKHSPPRAMDFFCKLEACIFMGTLTKNRSYYRVAWFVLRHALENTAMKAQVGISLFWNRHILRLSPEEIMAKLDHSESEER